MNDAFPPLDFGPRFAVACRSLVGPRGDIGQENQDNYLLVDVQGQAECLKDQQRHRFAVADWPAGQVRLALLDGVGGHGQGRQVAERIVEEIAGLPAFQTQADLNAALDALHHRIRQEFSGAAKAPGATLLLLEIPPERDPMLFHVGDSRLYAIDAQEALCLTVDHAPPTSYHLQGLIDAVEWQRQVHEENRSRISQAFGLGSSLRSPGILVPELLELSPDNLPPDLAAYADRRSVPLAEDRYYLLASDGFWTYPQPQEFIRRWPEILCARPQPRIDYLLDDLFEAHILASGDLADVDNSTAILLRLRDVGGTGDPDPGAVHRMD